MNDYPEEQVLIPARVGVQKAEKMSTGEQDSALKKYFKGEKKTRNAPVEIIQGGVNDGKVAKSTTDLEGMSTLDEWNRKMKPEADKVARRKRKLREQEERKKQRTEQKEEDERTYQAQKPSPAPKIDPSEEFRKEKEILIAEAVELGKVDGTRLAGLLYTEEGRKKTEGMLEELNRHNKKSRFQRKEKVRENTLYDIDTMNGYDTRGILTGGGWKVRKEIREKLEKDGVEDVDSETDRIFEEKEKEYYQIALARKMAISGRCDDPKTNKVRPDIKKHYLNAAQDSWTDVEKKFLQEHPNEESPWYVPSKSERNWKRY